MLEITQDSVVYQAQTKLLELAYEVAQVRNYKKPEAQAKIDLGFKIYTRLQAMDYAVYLDRAQRERIWYCLIELAGINNFPQAPVLGVIDPPTFLVGGGNTVINNNTYLGGTPFSSTVNIGTTTSDTFALASGSGAVWFLTIAKGVNHVSGTLTGTWLADGSNSEYSFESSPELGTIDVTMSMDISAGNVRLRSTSTSNSWSVTGTRYLIP